MSGAYFDAVRNGMSGVLDLFRQLALPIAVLFGLLAASLIVAYALRGNALGFDWESVRKTSLKALSYAGIGLVTVALWSGLKQVQPHARENIEWKDSAEASDNPAPDAPSISQSGPVAAAMIEKTYSKTLTLPPEFVERMGTDAVSVLSPYLVDPTAQNVVRLTDSFKRSGQDVTFTREVVRLDEAPVSFESADVSVDVHRLQGQAYRSEFVGVYTFRNPGDAPSKMRFLFTPPQTGATVQKLKVDVGGDEVSEPDDSGSFAWTGELKPREEKKATVRYQAVGAKNWSYDMGSNRRRVRSFSLTAKVDGAVQFQKGGLQPTERSGDTIRWKLNDVVTSQRLALKFAEDVRGRESFLQALATLPATLVLFGLGLLAFIARLGVGMRPALMVFSLIVFGFGLGSTAVLSNYVGPIGAVLLGPLIGAAVGGGLFGWRLIVPSVLVAMVPAASLSPQHTGLWMLILGTLAAVAFATAPRWAGKPGG